MQWHHVVLSHYAARGETQFFVDGKLVATLKGDSIAEDFVRMLDEYVARRFGAGARSGA